MTELPSSSVHDSSFCVRSYVSFALVSFSFAFQYTKNYTFRVVFIMTAMTIWIINSRRLVSTITLKKRIIEPSQNRKNVMNDCCPVDFLTQFQ